MPYTRLSDLLSCPHVTLTREEFDLDADRYLTLKWATPRLSPSLYLRDEHENVTICLQQYVPKLQAQQADHDSKSSLEQTLLLYVLLPSSCLCLAFSLAVHLILPALRTIPGKNNMMLISSLLATQLSLLIGYIAKEDDFVCEVFGLVTHYFSLAVISALLVSSYHVYTIFTTMHLAQDLPRDKTRFVFYILFVVIAPALIVITVAVLSSIQDHEDFGYGSIHLCYIRSSTLAWTVLFLPGLVVLVITTLLFCLTFASLRQNEDIETNITDEKHVHFYFRVNILTFLAWTCFVISCAAKVRSLLFLFLVLHFVLGVYFLVALIMTRRVTDLLLVVCCGGQVLAGPAQTSMRINNGRSTTAKQPTVLATGFRKTSVDFLDYKINIERNGKSQETADTHF